MIIPDYISPIVGYRAWEITSDGFLRSANGGGFAEPPLWPKKKAMQALCPNQHTLPIYKAGPIVKCVDVETCMGIPVYENGGMYVNEVVSDAEADIGGNLLGVRLWPVIKVRHSAPSKGCSCGIYAHSTEDRVKEYVANDNWAWGEVSLWGQVIQHTQGYRAQFAYPKALTTKYIVDAIRLEAAYGIAVKGRRHASKPVRQYFDLHP